MNLSHKIAIVPTVKQETYFRRACGTARFVWNWALAEWNRQHEAGEKPNALALKKQFNSVKYGLFHWLKDIHRDAHAEPFHHLGRAFARFFKGTSERPRFKRKHGNRDSFYIAGDRFHLDGNRIRLPIIGWVKLREGLRFDGRIISATVSHVAKRWFVSITIDVEDSAVSRMRTADGVIGIDVGVKHAAVLSTGEKIKGPKPLQKVLRRLRIASRNLSRKNNGSANRNRARRLLVRIYSRVANIRRDFWHKLSARLCRENQTIGVESLSVRGMVQNRHLSRAIVDVSFGALRPMLSYKAVLYGTRLVEADQFFPSSKTCSACGSINKELTLKDREWRCTCGAVHDRDINAARNLANLALRAVSPEVTPVRHDQPRGSRGRNRNKPQAAKVT